MKPNWKDAPSWANYLAMDEDGTWCWFNNEPRIGVLNINWVANGRTRPIRKYLCWRQTLEQRPEIPSDEPFFNRIRRERPEALVRELHALYKEEMDKYIGEMVRLKKELASYQERCETCEHYHDECCELKGCKHDTEGTDLPSLWVKREDWKEVPTNRSSFDYEAEALQIKKRKEHEPTFQRDRE